MPRAATTNDWLMLACLTVLWGSAFMLNEIALASYPPAVLVGGRLLIATVVLVAFALARGSAVPRGLWIPMGIMAVLGNYLPFQLVAWGQQHIDSSLAGVLMAGTPVFVLVLAHFFLPGNRLTLFKSAGVLLGLVGVLFVIGPNSIGGLGDGAALLGALAVLLATLSYACNGVYAGRLPETDPLGLAVGMSLISTMLCVPQLATSVNDIVSPTPQAALALLALGVLASGIATIIYFKLVRGPGPAFVSQVAYFMPVWAVFAGAVFLGENIQTSVYIGLGLILSGIAVSEGGPRVVRVLTTRRAAPIIPRTLADES